MSAPPLHSEAGLRARLAPAVFTLLELNSCYAYWIGSVSDDIQQQIRIRHNQYGNDYHSNLSYVDVGENNWDNIEVWKDAVALCCEQFRERHT